MTDTTETPQDGASSKTIDLHFAVTEERQEGLKWGVIRKIRQDPQAMTDYLAHFMVDKDPAEGGRYLTLEEAYTILDELTTAEISGAFEQVFAQQKEAAAPEA